MYYSQATIEGLLEEHAAIRGHMNQILELIREWKTLLTSEEAVRRNPDQIREISEKRSNLNQAMNYLKDGLQNHHVHEDEVLPP